MTTTKNSTKPKRILTKDLTGFAGEFAVAAKLCQQGYLTSITLRNAEGVDILACNRSATRTVAIQVKTNQKYKKNWILSKKAESFFSKQLFYIFVNLNSLSQQTEFHMVPSRIVARYISNDHQIWLNTPGKKGQPHNDSSVRKFSDPKNNYLNRWDLLGLDED